MTAARICSLLLLMFSCAVQGATPADYRLDVELFPETGRIQVSGRVTVEQVPPQDELVFDLHKTFSISALSVNGMAARFETIESEPSFIGAAARRVRVELPAENQAEVIELSIAYGGTFPDYPEYGTVEGADVYLDDEISPRRVELSLYSAWYPSFGFGARYDAELNLRSLPDGWTIACIGQEHRASETGFHCLGRQVNDLVIIASPDFKTRSVSTAAGELVVYHTGLPEAYVQRESRAAGQALAYFSEILGTPPAHGVLKNVYSPRQLGQGGYARVGMTVFSEGRVLAQLEQDPHVSHLRGSAHESGHFWWNFGAGQGDWINESFAEYFSLLAVREINGNQAFDSALAKCREAVLALPHDAPPIALVPFDNNGHGYTIRYRKGALMLDDFRRLLGDEAFYTAARGFYREYRNRKAGTAGFRAYWNAVLGENAHRVDQWLDTAGALPAALPERAG